MVHKSGLRAYPSFDISKGSVYNLLDPVVQLFVMSLIWGGISGVSSSALHALSGHKRVTTSGTP